MYKFRKGKITEATIIGVVGLLFAVWLGGEIAESSWAATFTLSPNKVIVVMAAYGFIASVLPVWMLLCPRDYLSSYLKIGTVAFLIIGVIVVAPTLHMPAFTPFVSGGGPIVAGKALSIRLHHDCLRRHQRFSRADFLRHDAQDDCEGNRRAHDRLRQHADGRHRRRRGVDCRDVSVSRRLLRHQHGAAN